ncbi:GNAT family N-acetyltransferase [Pantoea sp. 1.19]|uniref:GNAT family N-acetyltransferase n=1 Tax=Pantoea sp. 1.19 TaxID=1925589 RepID=UPI000948C127|nr:GNAT family N-acetyltransferase [Pantoea sp. 1.19]
MSDTLYTCARPAGQFTLRRWRQEDAALIHDWVTRDYARFWGMQQDSLQQVAAFYRELTAQRADGALIGCCNGQPAFLIECYQAQHDAVGQHYPAAEGDYGMHLLLAPPQQPVPQFSWQVFTVVMDYLFSRPEVTRVVVEPDVRNDKIHRLNRRAGFVYQYPINMGHKTAWLAFCQRSDYQQAQQREAKYMSHSSGVIEGAHLTRDNWAQANRMLVRKAIAEFSHERLLAPQPDPQAPGWWTLAVPASERRYRFRADVLTLEHWAIAPDSLEKWDNDAPQPLDAMLFIIEFAAHIGIPETMRATYLEEISSTLAGSAWKLAHHTASSADLVQADFQQVEAAMTEGHPGFVANNGRIGFDARDYLAYAPEVAAPVALIWVAVHRDNAHFSSIDGLSYAQLLEEELGSQQLARFHTRLRERGAAPEAYWLMPVHPWQWHNKLLTVFAADIARQQIILLGESEDRYQAQQSIRTFFNHSQPQRRYVKTALSVLNMGFMRGLSPYYMATTPAVNQWLEQRVNNDRWLQQHCHFAILREVAAIGYHNRYFEQAIAGDSAYKKMFAALWRDNPVSQLRPGRRLMTMASLLHVDAHQQALLPLIITDSGLPAVEWVRHYLRCYLSPLVHCFYQHDLVFMPHGENLILELEHNVPVRAWMKDIGEEIAVLNPTATLPEQAQRLAVDVPEHLKLLSLFTDVFDCFFRFVSAILHQSGLLSEDSFWQCVADCVYEWRDAHPALADKVDRLDPFVAAFDHSCLNRLQLANNQQMVNLADPASALKIAGQLQNPIARFRRQPR